MEVKTMNRKENLEFNFNTRVIGYVRVSTSEQVDNGMSLEVQTEKIQAYCKAKDWDLLEIISDKGYSAKDLHRKGIQSVIKKCKNKEINAVIVYKTDRLTRRQRDLWRLLDDIFEPHNVGYVSITEPIDTTTAQGKAFLGMIGVFSQLERDMISDRTTEALKHRKDKGLWLGRIPVGFKVNDSGKLAVNINSIKQIQRAKRLRNQGKSYRTIAHKLSIPLSTVFKYSKINIKSLKFKYAMS